MSGPQLAYSYLRFSSPEQAKGDSLRRQIELRDAWIAKSGAVLDTSLSFRDLGVSGYTGKHRENSDRHALAAFLELVRTGRIKRGSYLIVENLDRLSREHIRPALTLLLNLIESGIKVVQLTPVEHVFDEDVEPMQLMMAIMELTRGHSESRMKSLRVGKAWKEKKRQAANDKKPITARVPAWLRVVEDRFDVIELAAEIVKRIFRMAIDGQGVGTIAKALNREKVRPLSEMQRAPKKRRSGAVWVRSSVRKILTNRAVLGEYQPFTRTPNGRKAEGKPIANYFPTIIEENIFDAAQGALQSRRETRTGRQSSRVNLFSALLTDARDGGAIHYADKGSTSGVMLIPVRGMSGVEGSRSTSFPAVAFEEAILGQLAELNPKDILPRKSTDADIVLSLTGKRAHLEGQVEKIKAALLTSGEVASVVAVLKELEADLEAVSNELAQARRKAASPVATAWKNYRGVLDMLAATPKDQRAEMRMKLRAILRQMVSGVWCLFHGRGVRRLAAVQVHFEGGKHRDYLIVLRQSRASANGYRDEASVSVRSLVFGGGQGLDLRDPAQAATLDTSLEGYEWDAHEDDTLAGRRRIESATLRAEGMSIHQIAEQIGVTYAVAYKYLGQVAARVERIIATGKTPRQAAKHLGEHGPAFVATWERFGRGK